MIFIIAIITLLLALLYASLILYFRSGWVQMPEFVNVQPQASALANRDELMSRTAEKPSFSIIIPARNEEKNIKNCLESIIKQDFPPTRYEIIIIDDFSEDSTASVAEEFIASHTGFNIRLVKMREESIPTGNSFKKQSITTAIGYSRFDWIITSDADCMRGPEWLSTVAAFIAGGDFALVSAPVCFYHPVGFFQKMQAIEFSGLIAIGGASIYRQSPNMCNGANLVYRKDAFYTVNGFKGYDDIASGDDEFLMHKIHEAYPGKIGFLKNLQAVAYTSPAKDLAEFIQQRKRWVSKSRKYARKSITAILSGAYIFHLCLLVCLLAGVFNWKYLIIFLGAFAIKVLAEYLFLQKVTSFFKQKDILGNLVPAAFLYIFYVLFIGIYGNFGTYKWKGRTVK